MEIDGGADVTSYYVQFQVSIGPRPFGHGNMADGYPDMFYAIAFQLGHVLSDMEIGLKLT